jgi:HSP20 family protein
LDAVRTGDQVVVTVDLPGVDPTALDVTVEKDTLTVRGERSFPVPEGGQVLVSERPQGHFTRRLFLGQALNGERVEAHYENGVLTITIPVAESSRPRKIEITGGSSELTAA